MPALRTTPVGRNDFIADLVARLTSGNSRTALHGQAGVGKTTLAVTLAHHRQILEHFTDGVLWGSLGTVDPNPTRVLSAWAEALGGDISRFTEWEDQQQAVKTLVGQRCFLLVIDDVWDVDPAQFLHCGGPNCAHVLTTRDGGIARAYARVEGALSVPCLRDDWAYDLLQQWAPEVCALNPPAARALAQEVGGLPLALELLGGYLAAPERTLFPDLSAAALNEMGDPQRRLQLAQKRLGARGSKMTLQQTIALSLDTLPQAAVAAFYALGAFAPRPEHFSREAAEAVTQENAQVLALLVVRNLLEFEGDDLTLHQVVASVARDACEDGALARHRDYYLALAGENREDWQRIEAAYGQIKWAWAHVPADISRLDWIYALRIFHNRRGLWQDQITWIKAGLRVVQAEKQRKDEAILLNNIGGVYSRLGQRDKALDYYQRALPIMEEVGDRAGLATTLNNLGGVYDSLGQRDKALDYYQRALPIMEEVGDRAGLATTLNNIGGVYDSLGQRDKALDYYQRALPIMEEVGDRAGLATTLNNLGGVYDSLGQRDKALDYYQRALPIMEEVGDRYGESITRYNMAMMFRQQGRFAEAVVELEKVVVLDRLVQNPDLEDDMAVLAQVKRELAG